MAPEAIEERPLSREELAFAGAYLDADGDAVKALELSRPATEPGAALEIAARLTTDPLVMDYARRLARVRAALGAARQVLVVTGAGVSAESGIPTFRGESGWYRGRKAEELATLAAFLENPRERWEWYEYRRELVARAEPNAAHRALARWEEEGRRVFIITQNVDDLHERAGSGEVVHIHGSIWQLKCLKGWPVWEDRRVPLPKLPPDCPCGGIARPGVVWFDEELPPEACGRVEEFFAGERPEVAFVVGTEATFDYVRGYAREARERGALLVEVNPGQTRLTPGVDVHLRGKAGDVLPLLS